MRLDYYISKLLLKIQIPSIKDSKISKHAKICSRSSIYGCEIDRYSYVGPFTQINDCSIGAFCSIADYCTIGAAEHPMEFLSTSPVFFKGANVLKTHMAHHDYLPYQHTIIGNDVWIGSHVLIKSGVKVGNGAVIGMGAVVTKDVGDYEIWGGYQQNY